MPAMARNAGAGAAAAYAVESEDVEEKRVTRRIQLRDRCRVGALTREHHVAITTMVGLQRATGVQHARVCWTDAKRPKAEVVSSTTRPSRR